MKYVYDKSGYHVCAINEYDIDHSADIKMDSVLKISANKAVNVTAADTSSVIGVAFEDHSGVKYELNARNNKGKLLVYSSPSAVFSCKAPKLTASGGSKTTIIATEMASFADDDFNGGYAKLINKSPSSENTDVIGTVYEISDFAAADKTFTINAAGGAVTKGDVFEIYPPIDFNKGNYSSDFTSVVLTGTASISPKIEGNDINRGLIYVSFAKHV